LAGRSNFAALDLPQGHHLISNTRISAHAENDRGGSGNGPRTSPRSAGPSCRRAAHAATQVAPPRRFRCELYRGGSAMPNMIRQPSDAVLNRDGTVKVNGADVGFWWVWADIRMYHFDIKRPDNAATRTGVVGHTFEDQLKIEIPKYLAKNGKL